MIPVFSQGKEKLKLSGGNGPFIFSPGYCSIPVFLYFLLCPQYYFGVSVALITFDIKLISF